MLSKLFISLIASAVAVTAAPGLSLSIAAPDSVDGVQNLKLVAKVTNTGTDTLKLLNDPRTVLNRSPTHTFTITNVNGTSPVFTGIMVANTSRSALFSSDLIDVGEIRAGEGRPGQPGLIVHYS